MAQLGFKSVVYHGDIYLGELETVPVNGGNFQFPNNEIRIHHISPISERCHPLSVLQTVSSASVRCKLEPGDSEQSQLIKLHSSCFYYLKTAVVLLGNEEFHLVAMPSKRKRFPCFWCYSVPIGVYDSSLWMLNTRCLAIVFDLDETLIVANTMESIDDRINDLMGRMEHETDPIQESGMIAEMKRYVEDRVLLKQYAETNSVVDGGNVYQAQEEEVTLLSGGSHRVVRPVVRLPEKNIVFTRINPENPDTSVLVRLRPAWEDLKNYLTARGRKRYDVYVCTMAERDYALEMWRLLDPDARLISAKQLLDRVVFVQSGAKKSLLNVFRNGNGHPKMAMVIDDHLEVWEDRDQPRVHIVPPFTPYYAPQAEIANDVPVLCVARNVACNVRGGFFKEFDENLLQKISEIFYEDEIVNLPCSPDVSNFLISEDDNFVPNGNPSVPIPNGPEVAQRLEEKNVQNIESKPESSKLPAVPVATAAAPEHTRIVFPSQKPYSSVPAGLPHVKNVETNFGNDSQRQSPLQCGGFESDAVREIARRCGCKVEFRAAVGTNDDLQVSVEVFFGGEKISVGMGRSKEDAQQQAAENALVCLTDIISDMNSGDEVLTNADAPHPIPSLAPVNHAEKPEKFNGLNFKCWQQKMLLYLTTLNLARFLTEEAPHPEGEKDEQAVNSIVDWKHSDFLCRNCVMSGLEDAMYNEYTAMETAKELWEALDRKYKTEDGGAKKSKFIVGRFLEFKMVDSKPVVSQVQELQVILKDIHAEGMVICESFQVAAIIEKLPSEWKSFQTYLKQKRKEMNVEELVDRLRSEEDIRNSRKNVFNPSGQNSEGNKRFDPSSRGAKLGPKGGVSKKNISGKCFNCDGMGHRASDCKKPKRNREANMGVTKKKISIKCYNCDGKGHKTSDCKKPKRNREGNIISQDVSEMHLAAAVSELNREANMGDQIPQDVPEMHAPAVVSGLNLVRSNSGARLGPKGGVTKKIFFIKCYNCDGKGHKASDCKKPKRNREGNIISQDVSEMHLTAEVSELNREANMGDQIPQDVPEIHPPAVVSGLNMVRSNSGARLGPKGGVSKKKISGKCFNCDGMGHIASYCKKPRRKHEAYMANHISQDVSEMHPAAVVSELNMVEYGQF